MKPIKNVSVKLVISPELRYSMQQDAFDRLVGQMVRESIEDLMMKT